MAKGSRKLKRREDFLAQESGSESQVPNKGKALLKKGNNAAACSSKSTKRGGGSPPEGVPSGKKAHSSQSSSVDGANLVGTLNDSEMEPEGSESEDNDDGFEAVTSPKAKAREAKARAAAVKNVPPVKKVFTKPLTVTGLPSDIVRNQIRSLKHLQINAADVRRYDPLPDGRVLLHPASEEAKALIESLVTPPGISIKLAVKRPPKKVEGLSVVALRVDPSISDADIHEASGLKSKRLIAAKTSSPTYKVRIFCDNEAQKDKLIKEGLRMCGVRYKVELYKSGPAPLQCYKCQGLNHMAWQCAKPDKCMRCAGDHPSKDCPAKDNKDLRTCANCGGSHMANSFECSMIKQAKVVENTKQLTYAAAVAKKGDSTECHRLAAVITDVILSVVHSLPCGMGPLNPANVSELVAQAVSRHYKADVSTHCLITNFNTRVIESKKQSLCACLCLALVLGALTAQAVAVGCLPLAFCL